MENFLNNLYSYEYFGLYLMIAIAILILLFIIILFFGKKDKNNREIEATKKLQQINEDAFKETSVDNAVEVPNQEVSNQEVQNPSVMPQVNLENDTIIVPNINNIEMPNNTVENEIPEPILPQVNINEMNDSSVSPNVIEEPKLETNMNNDNDNNNINNNFNEPIINENPNLTVDISKESVIPNIENNFENNVITEPVSPILDKVEDKPLVFNNTVEPKIDKIVVPEIETVEPKVTPINSDIPEVEIPDFNFEDIMKEVNLETEEKQEIPVYTKGPDVFSSVYAPSKPEKIEDKVEIPEIDLPENRQEVSIPSSDELDMELPTLKKDVKIEPQKEEIEKPVLNDYHLDDLSGETYTINN